MLLLLPDLYCLICLMLHFRSRTSIVSELILHARFLLILTLTFAKKGSYYWSMHKKICDQFIVQRVDSSEDTCTEPGCGLDHILDPRTRKCIKLNSLSSHNAFEENDLQWHSHSTCAYHSQCRAAELGLIAEEHLNCFCDKFCIYYNDCCEDSPYQATVNSTLDHGVFACIQDRSDLAKGATLDGYEWGVMEVRGCPKDYTNLTIENLCKSNLHTPPFFFPAWYRHDTASVPVTDMHTGLR